MHSVDEFSNASPLKAIGGGIEIPYLEAVSGKVDSLYEKFTE